MAKGKTKKAKSKDKLTSTKPTKSKPKPTKQTKQNVKPEKAKVSALVPAQHSVPVLSTRIFGRNPRQPDQLLVVDTSTRLALAAMPIPVDATPRTRIAAQIGNLLMQVYDEMDAAQLPVGVRDTFEAHLACAFEAVGLACLF
jgi:hypothetical protein